MPINLKLSELMAKLTKENTVAFPKPLYAYKSFAILVPERFEWKDVIIQRYLGEQHQWMVLDWPFTLVHHGHGRDTYCRNDHFCHVYGYKPLSDLNPKFINAFYRKWTYFNVETKPVELDLNL